ncbi:MAG TPA: hypothetical protein VJ646_00095 [Candidatus Binatia bacterium]|nr:hypothetical protein [Candidatus Binatia bacterium]
MLKLKCPCDDEREYLQPVAGGRRIQLYPKTALYEHFRSCGDAGFANRMTSSMRHEFGGRMEKAAAK